jgi:hypothetical protein
LVDKKDKAMNDYLKLLYATMFTDYDNCVLLDLTSKNRELGWKVAEWIKPIWSENAAPSVNFIDWLIRKIKEQ